MENKYAKDVSNIKTLDPYRLQELYRMHPCAEHVVKKMLCAGERSGGKSLDKDISDCIETLTRWQKMREEDAECAAVSHNGEQTGDSPKTPESVSGEGWRIDFKNGGFELFNTTDNTIRARMFRKAEAMYDWSKAPKWAMFAATSGNGFQCWYENKPVHGTQGWICAGGYLIACYGSGDCPEWRETLEARPQ